MDVFGIKDGTAGLMKRPVAAVELTHKTFGGYLLRQGGTFLGSTNKGNPFKFPKVNLTKSPDVFLSSLRLFLNLVAAALFPFSALRKQTKKTKKRISPKKCNE